MPDPRCDGRCSGCALKPGANALPVYLSECGGYLCRPVHRHGRSAGLYEAWTRDGSIHWRDDNRIRTWADAAKPRHPMTYAVGGYSNTRTGQKKGSFTLQLLRCDTTNIVDPGTGNTIIESLDVVFRRKIAPQNVPHWLQCCCLCNESARAGLKIREVERP